MDDLLKTLDELIKIEFKQETQGGRLILEEPENEDYPVTPIKKLGKALAYQFDQKGFNLFPVFKAQMTLVNKVCD